MNVMEKKILEISERKAKELEDVINQVTPKWWRWCVNKGGIFKKIATYLIKVIVIERKN